MEDKTKKPLLVVLTPVLNEAWILPAFLEATSLWADYIIIADQMSTDGSRDIYKQYPKVIVVDNPRESMHQAATRRLLFDAAKKIEGDKIIFAIDADEFLSGDFPNSKGWKTIMNSEPGDVFNFSWMNLSSDATMYSDCEPLYWAAHLDNEMLNGDFPDNFIHELRLPWPQNVKHEYVIDDIKFIHFARTNVNRQRNKERFYQVSQSAPLNKYSGIVFYRSYHHEKEMKRYKVPQDAYLFYEKSGLDIMSLMNLEDNGAHYTRSVLEIFNQKGTSFFRKLLIWDNTFLSDNQLADPRRLIDKLMEFYLLRTQRGSDHIFVRCIDFCLKKIY